MSFFVFALIFVLALESGKLFAVKREIDLYENSCFFLVIILPGHSV